MRLGSLIARKPGTTETSPVKPAKKRQLRVRYRHWWWLPGWAFAAVTVLPALVAIAWLVPGTALLLGGRLTSVPMLIMFPALTLAVCFFALRQLPVSWPRFREDPRARRREPASRRPDVPTEVLAATLAIAAGYAIFQYARDWQQVVVTRDAGVYLQYAYWIAGHGTVSIPQSLEAFGGQHAGMNFASLGFFPRGLAISPAFLPGLPVVLSAGVWLHGVQGALTFGPVLGGCAVLAFAGLVGRLAGPRWAPAGALLLVVSLPEMYTSRLTLTEPLTQLLLFGGMSLVIDSMTIPARRHGITKIRGSAAVWQMRILAGLGGLALGLTVLVNLDALDILLPVLPFLALLAVGRRPQAIPLGIGFVAGAGLGVASGLVLARPYLDSVRGTLNTFGYIAIGVFAVSVVGAVLLLVPPIRRRVRGCVEFTRSWGATRKVWRIKIPLRIAVPSLQRALPWVAAALPVVALGLFLLRPYFAISHNGSDPSLVARLQILEGYRPDGTRSYAENSVYWVIWYLGIPALLMGLVGFSMLAWRCIAVLLRWRDPGGAARVWALPMLVFCWGTVSVLWAPDVVPDQPNASRRLVPVVLPGLIAAGVWAASRLRSYSRALGARRFTASAVAVCTVLAMGVPEALTTLGVVQSGRHWVTRGSVFAVSDAGETTAVRLLCDEIGPGASVVIVSPSTGLWFSQVIRGMCGYPVTRVDGASQLHIAAVVSDISSTGRHPVILGASSAAVSVYGGSARHVLSLSTTGEPQSLTRPPQSGGPLRVDVWLAAPDGQGTVSTAA